MTELYNKYIFELPIIPKVVSEILNIPSNSNISSIEIENILKIDPYLTSRLLKIANSSFYSRQREVNSIRDAITLIGLKKIKTICLLIAGSEIISNKKDLFYKEYWNESINTAFIAKEIANETGKSVISEDIFTAAILHNIGQAILYNYDNNKYNIIMNKYQIHDRKISDLETEEFGITNHKVGAGILQAWEFPRMLIDTVQYYLNPTSHSQFQNIIDIVSISKLINLKISDVYKHEKYNNLFLSYQSRLNLRNSKIDYYITEFFTEIDKLPFYQICVDTIFI